MEEVLSNTEIEKLLEQFESNNKQEDKAKEDDAYDFSKPHSIKKENIEALKIIFRKYTKHLANYFSELTREPVKGKLNSLEAIKQEEVESFVPKNSIIGTFTCAPLNGDFVTYIPEVFLSQIMEIVCGADIEEVAGSKADKIFAETIFTDLEMSIIEDITDSMIQLLVPSWKELLTMEVRLRQVQSHKDSAKMGDVGRYYLLATMSLDFYDIKGEIYLCIPFEALESITDKLRLEDNYDTLTENDKLKFAEDMNETIESVKVNLEVRLGEVSMTIGDFIQLEKGDVLQLNKHTSTPLDMYIEDKRKFKVASGKQKGNLAVKIIKITNEEGF